MDSIVVKLMLTMCFTADASAGQWDAASGFDAAPAPVAAEAGEWGAAPAPAGFDAAPAPTPYQEGQQQFQVRCSI